LLDGRNATSSKFAWEWATAQGPRVNWVGKARWVVDETPGKVPIWTSSGVAAGLDATFAFVKHNYGTATAERIANVIEYEVHSNADWDPFSKIHNVTA
jgi:transcriptional regulator GlxA family with amidase domain